MLKIRLFLRSGEAKYAHLSEADIQKVMEASKSALGWVEGARQALQHAPRHQPPPHTTHQIRQERQVSFSADYTLSTVPTVHTQSTDILSL